MFSNVKIEALQSGGEKPVLYSTLETVPIASADRRVAYVAPAHFEAPNWSRDGSYFLFNQDGGIYRLAVTGGAPGEDQYWSAGKVQQRSWDFAGWDNAGNQ